jgi:TatD DNase family protein
VSAAAAAGAGAQALEPTLRWVDTHCHLDAAEFLPFPHVQRAQAAIKGVAHCVIPAVEVANFDAVRALAHAGGDSYCLGIHPLYVVQAAPDALQQLDAALARYRDDPRLVAVGEIGLDLFVPALCESPLREKQEDFYRAQLQLARTYALPVVLHVRRSADRVLKHLREVGGVNGSAKGQSNTQWGGQDVAPWTGIAHAFNGSDAQAQAFIRLGFKLGFGGALTFERALQLRRLAQTLPLESIVLETDAPDIPPQWLYVDAKARAQGVPQGRNEPGEIPRIGAVLAQLRNMPVAALAQATTANACAALPKLAALLRG